MAWNPNKPNSLILAVHAAFINFDQILFFGGDQHDPDLSAKGQFDATCLFDCNSFNVTRIGSPSFDAFCSGHALAVGGRLVVAGGTSRFDHVVEGLHHPHFPGLRDAAVFTLGTGGGIAPRWIKIARMNEGLPARLCQPGEDPEQAQCVTRDHFGETGGRWYPTLLTLPNSNILAMAGHPGAGDMYHSNFIPEVFIPTPSAGGVWHRLGDFSNGQDVQYFLSNDVADFFPRLHVLPTGDVFCSTPIAGRTKSITIDQVFWRAHFNDICAFDTRGGDPFGMYSHYQTTSVLLPLRHDQDYRPRVLICGAERAFILDLQGWDPHMVPPPGPFGWQPTNNRTIPGSPRRMNLNAVILPTGQIFVSGGVAGQATAQGLAYLDTTAVQEPEIFNPDTDMWEPPLNDPATVVRNYHSVALLMPDGRVWTAGSDHNAGRGAAPGGAAELAIEVYEPWYYGNPDRPQILALPDRILTGTQFVLETTQAADIVRVAMVRCGSSTHAFDPDQRYVTLKFAFQGGNFLLVDAAPDGNIAPSGFYFYYTINRRGLPSNGWTTYVSSAKETEAERMWNNLTDQG